MNLQTELPNDLRALLSVESGEVASLLEPLWAELWAAITSPAPEPSGSEMRTSTPGAARPTDGSSSSRPAAASR